MAKDLNAPQAGTWINGIARNSQGGEVFESLKPDDSIGALPFLVPSGSDFLTGQAIDADAGITAW